MGDLSEKFRKSNYSDSDLISERVVFLLFDQVKQGSEDNTRAIESLTEAITELLKAVGNNPKETIAKIELILDRISENHNDLKDVNKDINYKVDNIFKKVEHMNAKELTVSINTLNDIVRKLNDRVGKLFMGISISFTIAMVVIGFLVHFSSVFDQVLKQMDNVSNKPPVEIGRTIDGNVP